MKTQINVRIEEDVKKKAQKKAEELGVSFSELVNTSLENITENSEFPLIETRPLKPHIKKLIEEGRKEYERGETSGPFDNLEDLFKHLDS